MILPGVITSAGAAPLANPVQVQRVAVNFTATGEITLPGAPTVGNILLLTGYVSSTNNAVANPAGWTELERDPGGVDTSIRLLAKVSDGSETTVTAPASRTLEYQEWSGLAGLGSLYDAANSALGSGAATSFNPASLTPDQDRAVFLCTLHLANSSGGVTTDWVGADDTYNQNFHLSGHKIVTDGAAFDTSVSWTTSRAIYGGVFCLRGES